MPLISLLSGHFILFSAFSFQRLKWIEQVLEVPGLGFTAIQSRGDMCRKQMLIISDNPTRNVNMVTNTYSPILGMSIQN